jgi:hypothetical protein
MAARDFQELRGQDERIVIFNGLLSLPPLLARRPGCLE